MAKTSRSASRPAASSSTDSGAGEQRPRRRNRAQTIEVILDAAEALLENKGPDGFGLAELGQEAGVSFGLIHHYFGGKEGLLRAVLQRALREIGREIITLQQRGDFWNEDAPAVEVLFEAYTKRPAFARLLAWGLLTGLLSTEDVLAEWQRDRDAVVAMTDTFRAGVPGSSMRKAGATGVLLSSTLLGYILLRPLLEGGFGWTDKSENELRQQLVDSVLMLAKAKG